FLAKLKASSDFDLTIHAYPPKSFLDILRSDAAETFFLKE
ncbi:hypothetical protein A2U01_0060359, partial [Trifolium medium]|nr:hypothetical protein [Trifolium medium]